MTLPESPKPRKRIYRRRGFWIAAALSIPLFLVLALSITGCLAASMVEPADESGLGRFDVDATLRDETEINVSVLVSTTHERSDDDLSLLYVHGTPGDATNWVTFLREPVAGLPSYSVDRPGFGKSASDKAYVSFADQSAALGSVLNHSINGRAILVGHSLGGPIIARAAVDFPKQVAAIVIVSGSLDPDLEELQWYNHAMKSPVVSIFFPDAFKHSNDEILAAEEETKKLADMLDRVRCPVVIVHGTADRLVPFANVAYMKRKFANAADVTTVELQDADHFIIWTDKEKVRSAIETAIAMVRRAALHKKEKWIWRR